MGVVALADFGSTYTKVSLVDRAEGRLLGRGEAPTTVGTDLMEGYAAALAAARAACEEPVPVERALAASSAGGGLRVAAIGLVADLTAAAARQAALNAGARVGTVLAGMLEADDLERLERGRPEIVLFAGGTDGGRADLVLENARRLASRPTGAFVIVACNGAVAERVAALLREAGSEAAVAGNVMPRLGEMEIEPAREAILRAFLQHVIGGKGLSASREFERMVRMPTPEAVLEATRLLARGGGEGGGVGDALVVDVGGATTDVHSDRTVRPPSPGTADPLLPPPATLRTVEGDLGLRAGAGGVVEADGRWIAESLSAGDARIRQGVLLRSEHPDWLPSDREEAELDGLLAVSCATEALRRHCGMMLLGRGQDGTPTMVRDGADLREVAWVFGTGGVFAHRGDGERLLRDALARRGRRSLAPTAARVRVDRSYVLAAAGLLATLDPRAASRLLRRELLSYPNWTD